MSKDTKYIPSGGLLLSEHKDMMKLTKLAKQGWILESFKNLGYKLRKGEPQDIQYCIDYNEEKEDLEEYLSLFENSDWTYICSFDGYHFFKAPKGTSPIYSDKETLSLKYEKQYKLMKKAVIYDLGLIVACFLVIRFIGKLQYTPNILRGLKFVCYTGGGAALGILIPFLICTVIAHKKIKV